MIAIPIVITVFAGIVRLGTMAQPMWFDELITAAVSQEPFGRFYDTLIAETLPHLPLYRLIIKPFAAFLPFPYASRLPAFLFGVAAIPLMYAFTRRLAGDAVAAVATFLLAVSPMHVYHSENGQEYSLLLFASLMSIHGMLVALDTHSKRAWLACFAGMALSIQATLFGFLAVFAIGCMFVVALGRKKAVEGWTWRQNGRSAAYFAAAGALALILWLPNLPVLRTWLAQDFASGEVSVTAVAIDWPFFRTLIEKLTWGSGLALIATLSALILGAALLALYRGRAFLAVIAQIAGAMLALFVVVHYSREQIFESRYVIFLLPAVLLVVAYGWWYAARLLLSALPILKNRPEAARDAVASVAACVVATLAYWPAWSGLIVETNENWRDTCSFISENARNGDAIILQPAYADYALAFAGKNLPPVTPLAADDVATLQALMQTHRRLWYVGKWGERRGATAEAMDAAGFITIFDPWAQGLHFGIWDSSVSEADRVDATITWRERALGQFAYRPLMDAWLARAYRDAGAIDEATRHYERAIKAQRKRAKTDTWSSGAGNLRASHTLALARLLVEVNNPPAARQAFAKAIWLDPRLTVALYEWYRMEDAAGNTANAARILDIYLEREPAPVAWSHKNLADLSMRLREYEQAADAYMAEYRIVKASDSGAGYYWAKAAMAFEAAGQTDRAIAELRVARDAHQTNPFVAYCLALVLHEDGRDDEALEAIERAMSLDPSNEDVSALRDAVRARLGNDWQGNSVE